MCFISQGEALEWQCTGMAQSHPRRTATASGIKAQQRARTLHPSVSGVHRSHAQLCAWQGALRIKAQQRVKEQEGLTLRPSTSLA